MAYVPSQTPAPRRASGRAPTRRDAHGGGERARGGEPSRTRLSERPLPEVLVRALERGLSGSFVLEAPDHRRSTIVVAGGQVTKVHTAKSVEPLGRVLVDMGAISPSALERGAAVADRDRQCLGEVLLRLDLVDERCLRSALCEQLARRIAWMGRWPRQSVCVFHEAVDFLVDRPAHAVDPIALIWRSISGSDTGAHQKQVLSRLMNEALELHPAARPERLGLTRTEMGFVQSLRDQPKTLGSLLQSGHLDAAGARRLVYALVLTHQLKLEDGKPPLTASRAARFAESSVESDPPRSSSTPASASTSSASSLRLPASAAAQRRPSSVPAPPDVERALQRVARGRSASLGRADARAAREAFEQARQHEQRDQLDEAERKCRDACSRDPRNPEYLGLHAWIRVRRGALSHPKSAEAVLGALNRAALKQRDNLELRLYRARALWRLGRHAEAGRDFAYVAQRDPSHLEAQRHLRLGAMRTRNRRHSAAKVLSRIFSR